MTIDRRVFILFGLAIGRAQAQHALGVAPGGAKSAANRQHRPHARKEAGSNFQSFRRHLPVPIDESTRERIGDAFEVRYIGAAPMTGKAAKLPVYQDLGLGPVPGTKGEDAALCDSALHT